MELKEIDDRMAFLDSSIEELRNLRNKTIKLREKIEFLVVQLLYDPALSKKCATIDEIKEFLIKQDDILKQLHDVDVSFILKFALMGVDSDLKDEKSVIERADEHLKGNQDCLNLNTSTELEEDLNVKSVNEQSDEYLKANQVDNVGTTDSNNI